MFVLPTLKPEEVIIYLRKSRTDDPSLSVAETVAKHEQMLDDWCMRNLGEVVPEQNRFREIVSGETIEARPEIKKVLRLIEQDKFKAILIVEPQRLSRGDLEDIGRISKLLRYTHTFVITLQYSYDLADERDRDYFERELKRGNEYLEYSKRILRNGVRASVERGNYLGTRPPYGYERVKIKEDGKRATNTLRIIPEEAEIVRTIFRMYASGNGTTLIAKEMERIGAIPPHMSGKWTREVIYDILDNVHYIGKVKWNARKTVRIVEDGEIRKSRPRTKPEVFDGKHEAIISDELWEKVREARKERHMPKVRSSLDLQNPLSGLLYCECGRCMRQSEVQYKSRRYFCPNQSKCQNSGCVADVVKKMIADTIRQEIADRTVQIGSAADDEALILTGKIKALESKIETLKAKQDGLWEKYAEGMPKDTFERLISKNKSALTEATETLRAARSEADSITIAEESEARLYAALDALESETAPIKETNALLKSVIKRITYSRKKAHREQCGGNRAGWVTYDPELEIEFLL